MRKHVILYSIHHPTGIHGAADAQIRLKAWEIRIFGKDSNQLINKGFPLVEEEG